MKQFRVSPVTTQFTWDEDSSLLTEFTYPDITIQKKSSSLLTKFTFALLCWESSHEILAESCCLVKKFTWYIRGELLCLVVGKSEEWWLAGQDVKQLTPRQLHFPIYGVSDKWWDGLAIMLHHTYPDEQLLNICYWFYFATDDHGRPNQRAESGPDGRKIGRCQKATTWAAAQSVGFYLIWSAPLTN